MPSTSPWTDAAIIGQFPPTRKRIVTPSRINRADALLFGRVTYEMMEAAFLRKPLDLRLIRRLEMNSGAIAMRYKPT